MPRRTRSTQVPETIRIPGAPEDEKAPVQKLTVRLNAKQARLLKAYCAYNGRTARAVVADALECQLAGFYCATQPARGTRSAAVRDQPESPNEERSAG